MFLDTQILSNVKKGRLKESIRGSSISSVVASELLMVYSAQRTAASYYVPLLSPLHMMIQGPKMDHPFSKRSTDQIVFDFGSDYPALIEFGSFAISKMINERNVAQLRRATGHLDSKVQRLIREDFDFMVSNDIECHPLRRSAILIAHKLLAVFKAGDEAFRGTFRNSWNDLLILASAWDQDSSLRTKDSQLNRIAAGRFGKFTELQDSLSIQFPSFSSAETQGKESPEYVNQSWRVFTRNHSRQAW